MHQKHNMSYAEYASSLDQMMKVEQKRQEDFEQSKRFTDVVSRQLYK
ncbi:hypothetical protein [Halobacillus massiliensis]|nr:hypothetical protein [Halobacillus massiliensis]